MKLLKTLSVAAVVAGITGTSLHAAPTIIHVAGSTAFRGATVIACIDYLAGNVAPGDGTVGSGAPTGGSITNVYAAWDQQTLTGKNLSNANAQILANGTIGAGGTATTIIECTWTGSLSGVVDLVAGSSNAQFLDETNPVVIAGVNAGHLTASYTGSTSLSNPGYHSTNQTVDLAMSDSLNTTIANELGTATLTGTISSPTGTYTGATGLKSLVNNIKSSSILEDAGVNFNGTPVAVVPFEWVLGSHTNAYTSVTNMTQQIARALFNVGYVPQSFFTGASGSADTANYIYLIGRDEDSGTRIGALSESQNGVTNGVVKQYQVGDGATTYSPISLVPGPSALFTEPNISWPSAGHSGYFGGANVQYALNYPNPGTSLTFSANKASGNSGASYFVGYLGLSDAKNAVGASPAATALTYNGVPFSYTAVANGSYSFWTYEHCYRLASQDGTAVGTAIDTIADIIAQNDADISYSASSGVTHNYNAGAYTSGISCPGLFNNLTNAGRSTTEGLPITH
jgi:hypothetical protein